MELWEFGLITHWYEQEFYTDTCQTVNTEITHRPLNILDVVPVFIIVAGGMVIAFIVLCVELIYNMPDKHRKHIYT